MRRRALLAVALVALAVALLTGRGGPSDDAVKLVPDDAQLYFHTTAAARAAARPFVLLHGFPDEPWMGDEAAYAELPSGEVTLLEIDDEDAARAYAEREGGTVRDGFVVLGEAAGKDSLGELEAYATETDALREDRDAHVWLRGGALDLPFADRDVAIDVVLTSGGAEIGARRFGGADTAADFDPQLLDAAPESAFGYLGVRGLEALAPLLPDPAFGPLMDALGGEIAVTLSGEDAITLVAIPDDVDAAQAELAGLQGVIASALAGSETATGQVPVFVERDLGDGLTGFALTLAGGGELIYAVDGERVAVSSSDDGVRGALRAEQALPDSEGFEAVMPAVDGDVQALAFVAAKQLLELAEAAGLDASAIYQAARPDLSRISALGAVVRRQGDDTTVELNLRLP